MKEKPKYLYQASVFIIVQIFEYTLFPITSQSSWRSPEVRGSLASFIPNITFGSSWTLSACGSLSAVQIYDFHIFLTVFSSLHGFISNHHHDQLPVGLLAQLVERCTGIKFKSRTGLKFFFFRPYFHYCLSSAHHCEDHFHS